MLGKLNQEISFETEKSITRAKKVAVLTQEKHILEQEIAGFKEDTQLLSSLKKEKRQFMQEMRTVVSAKDRLLLEVQVLKDEKHQIEQEMPGAKALQDKLSQKTLVANAQLQSARTEDCRCKGEAHQGSSGESSNAKKDRAEQEIQLMAKERRQLLQDILAMKPAVMAIPPVGASKEDTDPIANPSSMTDSSEVGQALSMTPMILLVCVVLLVFLVARFPISPSQQFVHCCGFSSSNKE